MHKFCIYQSFNYLIFVVFIFIHFQPKPIDVNVISHQMQRYAVWFGGSMLASTVKISMHNLFCQIYLFFIHKLWVRIWKDILKNTLCICSLTFIKCATQKRNTTNMVPQFAATIRCLERWRKKNNVLAIFCFHFDYIFSKRKKAFVFAFWFIYITVIKEKKTQIQSEIQFDIGAIGLGF